MSTNEPFEITCSQTDNVVSLQHPTERFDGKPVAIEIHPDRCCITHTGGSVRNLAKIDDKTCDALLRLKTCLLSELDYRGKVMTLHEVAVADRRGSLND